MKYSRDLILQVKEMLERGWDVASIASRMHMDPYTIQAIVDFINNLLT
jgi:DNA-binding NarL/FixJ family response regulator